MKKSLLFILAVICSLTTFAQNDTYKYHFNGNLNEMYLKAPSLTAQCAGTYGAEALPAGLTKQTYRFDKGCGVVYSDAVKNFIASGTYTIELYFRLDTISGYKKLIDFDSLKQDAGLYNQSGKIVLYPNFTSVDSFVGAGVYQYVAISRDGTSKKMYVNANGKTAGSYTDNTNLYKLGTDKLLMFFRDDKGTGGEQSKGAVAMIQISNYAIDTNGLKSKYAALHGTLDVPVLATSSNDVAIYPNPASSELHVTLAENSSYTICDITGKVMSTGSMLKGSNNLALHQLSNGLYLLRILSPDGKADKVCRFSIQ